MAGLPLVWPCIPGALVLVLLPEGLLSPFWQLGHSFVFLPFLLVPAKELAQSTAQPEIYVNAFHDRDL
jgi:hypothetical protein